MSTVQWILRYNYLSCKMTAKDAADSTVKYILRLYSYKISATKVFTIQRSA